MAISISTGLVQIIMTPSRQNFRGSQQGEPLLSNLVPVLTIFPASHQPPARAQSFNRPRNYRVIELAASRCMFSPILAKIGSCFLGRAAADFLHFIASNAGNRFTLEQEGRAILLQRKAKSMQEQYR
jgi:hypothetical protein